MLPTMTDYINNFGMNFRQTPLHHRLKATQLMTRTNVLRAYLSRLRYSSDAMQGRFLLLANNRTGSHLLLSLLNTHPQLECLERETFHGYNGMVWPHIYLDWMASRSQQAVFGCKVSIRQLLRQRPDTKQLLTSMHQADWQFISLQRRNVWRQVISGMMAQQRQIWRDTSKPQLDAFYINIDELLRRMAKKEKVLGIEQSILASIPHLTVIYEDDLLHPEQQQATADKAFAYLGVASVPVSTPYIKSMPQDLSTLIINYEAMVAAIKETSLAYLLEE